ncbi:hypothetical protein FRC00_012758, partial [Tulasnella sp. 408]
SDNEDVMGINAEEYNSEIPPVSWIDRILGEAAAKKRELRIRTIANEIENIFSRELSSTGAFCFEKTYLFAPNPTLRLAGAGHIGLPVNSRDALAVKEHSRPIKDGPLGTDNAEHAWIMKASKQAALRPAEAMASGKELNRKGTCFPAGVAASAYVDRHVLRKLPNAVFATLIITLPCAFTGGQVDISHEGVSKTIDQARNSLLNTSATAWYRGLTPEFKPITDGHRLALHYHLIHTTTSPRPTLPSLSRASDLLGKVLTFWKTSLSDPETPRKIVYLLDRMYHSGAKLTEHELKGCDAHIVSVLKDTAQKSGFKLLLAHLELSSQGDARCDPGQKWGRRQYCHSDHDSGRGVVEGTDPSRLEFKDYEDVQYGLELSQLGALDGTPLKDKVDIGEILFPVGMQPVESIPEDLAATLERGSKPDVIEYVEGESK